MRCLVYIGGYKFTSWNSISVTRTLDKMCGSFKINAVYNYGVDNDEQSPFIANEKIEIFYLEDGESEPYSNNANDFYKDYSVSLLPSKNSQTKILTGWIDKVITQLSSEGLTIVMTGRDKTCDLVDCTIESETLEWIGYSVERIANEWCSPFGIEVDLQTDKGDSIIDSMNPSPDQKVADAFIKFVAKKKGFLAITDEDGRLVLEDKGGGLILSPLRIGGNVVTASYMCDYSKRFSKLKILNHKDKSPSIFGSEFSKKVKEDGASSKTSGVSIDNSMTRYRPIALQSIGNSDDSTCESESDWRMKMSMASSYTLSVKVNGWVGESGDLWRVNRGVYCELQDLNLPSGIMLIKTVNFTLDSSGTFTNMELIHDDAYSEYNTNKTGKKAKKDTAESRIKEAMRGLVSERK